MVRNEHFQEEIFQNWGVPFKHFGSKIYPGITNRKMLSHLSLQISRDSSGVFVGIKNSPESTKI